MHCSKLIWENKLEYMISLNSKLNRACKYEQDWLRQKTDIINNCRTNNKLLMEIALFLPITLE